MAEQCWQGASVPEGNVCETFDVCETYWDGSVFLWRCQTLLGVEVGSQFLFIFFLYSFAKEKLLVFFLYFLNWRIIALQNFVVFHHTSIRISHRYTQKSLVLWINSNNVNSAAFVFIFKKCIWISLSPPNFFSYMFLVWSSPETWHLPWQMFFNKSSVDHLTGDLWKNLSEPGINLTGNYFAAFSSLIIKISIGEVKLDSDIVKSFLTNDCIHDLFGSAKPCIHHAMLYLCK